MCAKDDVPSGFHRCRACACLMCCIDVTSVDTCIHACIFMYTYTVGLGLFKHVVFVITPYKVKSSMLRMLKRISVLCRLGLKCRLRDNY